MTEITDHLAQIRGCVASQLEQAGRAREDAMIVAVSKGKPADAIREARAAGQVHFGESYIQELQTKAQALADLEIVWHFIGRIQSNKTRSIARHAAWVHTLDREKIAARLDRDCADRAPLNVLIQVNQAGESQKGGVTPDEAPELALKVAELPNLRLRGLMCIPPAKISATGRGEYFAQLRQLQARLVSQGLNLDTLSMGMSGDFETALAQGSNCVRVGTAIFGARPR